MAAQVVHGLLLLLLCLSRSTTVSGVEPVCVEAVGPAQPICAIVGEEFTFSCHLTPNVSAAEMEVMWQTEGKIRYVHIYENGTDDDESVDEIFTGRTRMIRNDIEHGAVTWAMSNVTRNDARIYMCSFVSQVVETYAEFEVKVAGRSACDLEKELDDVIKVRDDLIKVRDNLQKDKDDLIKVRDNLQKDKDNLQKDKDDLIKVRVRVTLDPDTANRNLLLSEDGKEVTWTSTDQPYPAHPKRFTVLYWAVLGREGFSSGRHYWELQLLKEHEWVVGVARESVRRESVNESPEWGIWALRRWHDGSYYALTSPRSPLSPSQHILKLGLYLDYEGGRLSFYNAYTMEEIYTFTGAAFGDTVHPYFNLGVTNLRLL